MKKLWITFIVLAALGSIYPFNFQPAELDVVTIGAFLRSCCTMPSRGDILGNVILFIPIGLTGMLATRPESSASRSFLYVCLIGVGVALALQVMQIFLPSRDENLQDVVWNLFGTAGGAALARLVRVVAPQSEDSKADASLVPLTLVGTWLIYRLIPFVPSLDLQLVKDSVKPLLELRLDPVSIIRDATAWLVVAFLLRHAQRGAQLDTRLPALMVIVFCLEVLIVDNSVNSSNLTGAIVAVLVWFGLLRYIRWQAGVLVILLLCTLTVSGLAPFDIRLGSVPFNWFPFHGFLGGSMYVNTQSAAEKVFLYGSLVYLLWRTRLNVFGSIFAGLAFVAIIEFAQTRFVGHTPEITDPLLVIFAAAALLALEIHEDKSASDSQLRSQRRHQKWVNQTVNLRGYQFDFVVRLSQEMGVSISRVTRRIVAQFIEELGKDISIEPIRTTTNHEPGRGRDRWVSQSVNLHGDQFDLLVCLSREMGVSVSRVTRRIVALFIDGLDREDEPNDGHLT